MPTLRKPQATRKTTTTRKTGAARGCTVQSTKKYSTRPSPAMPANNCCGMTMVGNDGNIWKSVPNVKGICRWVKIGQTGGWSW